MRERDASDRAGCTRRCRHRTHLALPFCGACATWMRLRLQRQRQRRLGPKLEVRGGARWDEAKEVAWHQNCASLCVSLSQCYLQCHTHVSHSLAHICVYVCWCCMHVRVCVKNVCGVSERIEIATINKKVLPCLPAGNKQIEMTKFIVDFMYAHTYPDTRILALRRTHIHTEDHTHRHSYTLAGSAGDQPT